MNLKILPMRVLLMDLIKIMNTQLLLVINSRVLKMLTMLLLSIEMEFQSK